MKKPSKNYRILDMYVRLFEGKVINKTEEVEMFGIDGRTFQRDIADIRSFLSEQNSKYGSTYEVMHDRSKKVYILVGSEPTMMTNNEILAVSKILLASRGFTYGEMSTILNKLVDRCAPRHNMELVSELISNEKFHYTQPNHKEDIKDLLWDIGTDIYENTLVSFEYTKANSQKELVKRVVEPISILFSEYYFYLNGFIVDKDKFGDYVEKYDHPAVFRIDRIQNYKSLNKKFKIPYGGRFEEGLFRKRTQFMYPGKLLFITLKYFGNNPEPILDRLPTARIIEQGDEHCTIKAEVYGKGIIMWILSQGNKIEVLGPKELREDMKSILQSMLENYD